MPGLDNFNVTVLRQVDTATLADAMRENITACVERGTEGFLSNIEGDVIMVLTTRTAFAVDIATIFTNTLIERHLLPEARRKDLKLALHEALANGLMHGNLEMPSHAGLTPEDFLEHAALMEERLNHAEYGNRPIALSAVAVGKLIEVTVSDCGKGYSPELATSLEPTRLAGRGLRLMIESCDAIRHEDEGRKVVLSYARPDESQQNG
jgi:sigma-B regulation protein RsbU (phosphoserine phosphatase)